jgi:hypothetical protein
MIIKHQLKTSSNDPRPVKHIDGLWYVVGMSYLSERKHYWLIIVYLSTGEDVHVYYPEAFDVESERVDKEPSIFRGGALQIAPILRGMGVYEHLKFMNGEYNPTFLFVIESLASRGVSQTEIAKRMGVAGNRFRAMLKKDPVVLDAYTKGYERFLKEALNR